MKITAEKLAYWYLRLNGFLTVQNFVVHPDTGSNQRTDADILGVRFPYRAELISKPMLDDVPFRSVNDKPYLVIAEVKTGKCDLNGPWTDRERGNLPRVLRAVGAFPDSEVEMVAKAIDESGGFSNRAYHLTLVCFGRSVNDEISEKFPDVPQVLWDQVLTFVYNRFTTYRAQKSSHNQWDTAGKSLWNCVRKNRCLQDFKVAVEIVDR